MSRFVSLVVRENSGQCGTIETARDETTVSAAHRCRQQNGTDDTAWVSIAQSLPGREMVETACRGRRENGRKLNTEACRVRLSA
jgi:hypothetical protein